MQVCFCRFVCLHSQSFCCIFLLLGFQESVFAWWRTRSSISITLGDFKTGLGGMSERRTSRWNGCALDYVVCQRGCSFIWLLILVILRLPRMTLIIQLPNIFLRQTASDWRQAVGYQKIEGKTTLSSTKK